MKILVLSDSHSSLRFMRQCIDAVKPDAVVHLGDHYDDAQALAEDYHYLRFYQVPGNCDTYRCPPFVQSILCIGVCGVRLYMTHGHLHHVKQTLSRLLADARAGEAQAALYGHTHVADCHTEPDGLWVLNPGSSGIGGSAGIIETDNNQIVSCRIVRQEDLEDLL